VVAIEALAIKAPAFEAPAIEAPAIEARAIEVLANGSWFELRDGVGIGRVWDHGDTRRAVRREACYWQRNEGNEAQWFGQTTDH
jgi:hypothetical protein